MSIRAEPTRSDTGNTGAAAAPRSFTAGSIPRRFDNALAALSLSKTKNQQRGRFNRQVAIFMAVKSALLRTAAWAVKFMKNMTIMQMQI
jgi:hypothetical protein